MNNVIPLKSTGGFTRMENDLYEALIGADLSGRELRVALALHRLTAGFNKESVKVAALYISKMMYADEGRAEAERANVSRSINALIRQRVIFRDGGSRDPIAFLPPKEWKIEPSATVLKSTHCVENTRATVLKITHIKDRNTNTTSDEVVGTPAPVKAKRERKPAFGKLQILADNPHQVPDQLITDWLALRKTKRATVSQTVWDSLNAELTKCAALGITAVDAMTEALTAGWQGFKADWIANRLTQTGRAPTAAGGPDFYDTSWRHDLSDEL
jgi:phage replication O-like protein O